MEIFYENSKKEKLNLQSWPLMLQEPEKLFSNKWSYKARSAEKNGGKIEKFYKSTAEKTATISVFAESRSEYQEIMARFEEICGIDIVGNTAGKLYVNGWYMPCFIFEADYSEYEEDFYTVEKKVSIVSPMPFWINPKRFIFSVLNNTEHATTGKDYPHDFAYDFKNSMHSGYVKNTGYSDADFEAIIYGACENPSFSIGEHTYSVNTSLYTGEYIVINSAEKKLYKVKNSGEKENIFHLKGRSFYIFERIPAGINTVSWSGFFGFDIVIFSERSEPLWK